MKFNPETISLFTNNGELIKKLHCPGKVSWNSLATVSSIPIGRNCSICNRLVLDTALFNDEDLLEIVKRNPETCLKVQLDQPNIKLMTNEGR